MSWIIAILLGLVQGIAEFLPISSSGHLTLISKIFGFQNNIFLISILLHFATLFAIVWTFRKYIWGIIKHPLSKDAINIYITIIPTILIVLFFKSYLNDYFANSKLLPYGLLLTATLLLLTYLIQGRRAEQERFCGIKRGNALLMGIVQGFATIPGISRAGSTICTGLLGGEKREEVTRFSFVMSIPIIAGSLIYEFIKGDFLQLGGTSFISPLIVSFLTAFIVGIFAIKFMLRIMKNAKYYWFAIYLFVISFISFFIV